jgi:hypothetical protein
VLALSDVLDLLVDELSGCRAGRLPLPQIFLCLLNNGLFWHRRTPPVPVKLGAVSLLVSGSEDEHEDSRLGGR